MEKFPSSDHCQGNAKVAILLAVYNGQNYLEALLHSLFSQKYSNFHIYARDNCSTDDTKSILLRWQHLYPDQFDIIFSETNIGCIGNFSALLNAAKEPYAFFCDHDDIWLPEKISSTMAEIKKLEKIYGNHTPIAVHTDLAVVDHNLKSLSSSLWKSAKLNTSERSCTFPRLLVQNQVTGCTLGINRSLIDLASPIPEECIMHDWWIALVAACFGKIGSIAHPTILYRQHTNNDTGAKAYTLWSHLLRKNCSANKFLKDQKHAQTKYFLSRYQNRMTPQQIEESYAYLAMHRAPFYRFLFLMWKYKFFKSGFLRNLILNH